MIPVLRVLLRYPACGDEALPDWLEHRHGVGILHASDGAPVVACAECGAQWAVRLYEVGGDDEWEGEEND